MKKRVLKQQKMAQEQQVETERFENFNNKQKEVYHKINKKTKKGGNKGDGEEIDLDEDN